MKTSYIDVDNYWGIIICCDFSMLDIDDMAAMMDAFGMNEGSIREAMRVLFGINSGMHIARDDLRMSLVFIGEASSETQWWDTLAHEVLDHAREAILRHYGVDSGGEDSAWTTGYLMRELVYTFGVPCLRKEWSW